MKLKPVDIPNRPRGLKFEISALVDARFEISAQDATITIFDVIGLDVTPARIAGALRSIGEKPVTVQINSPGGDPFDGLAIFNLLRGHSKPISVQILGIAASAASLVAMAGQRIEIARAAEIMIHRAAGLAAGTADTMLSMSRALAKIDETMAGVYAARTGLPREQIVAMMTAETFMSSDEALDLGFADALLDRDAEPAPRVAANAAPQSKRDLEEQFRRLGFSRAEALRMTAAAWPAREGADPEEVDLDRLSACLNRNFAAIESRFNPKRQGGPYAP